MTWTQRYAALGAWSAPAAALPIVLLLALIASGRVRPPVAAGLALLAAMAVAVVGFGMPATLAWRAAAFGAAYGLWPVGWIVLNVLFLYRVSVEAGQFRLLRGAVERLVPDRPGQVLLVGFCLGGFLEGAAGFGAPVAICGALLAGLGFAPIEAAVLSLLANTAPVAFGALGIQTVALAGASGLPLLSLAAMAGRLVAPFCLLVPVWLLVVEGRWRRRARDWPAAIAVGASYAAGVLLLSRWHGPWLAAIVPPLVAGAVLLALRCRRRRSEAMARAEAPSWRGAAPWLLLIALVFLWGLPAARRVLDGAGRLALTVPGLDGLVHRAPPFAAGGAAEPAVLVLNFWSATGTAILMAAVIGGLIGGTAPTALWRAYRATLGSTSPTLATIAAMLGLGTLTRFAGLDATMGLALARTGAFYPLFGTLLGWLGTAATGSDTASNVLFGSLQRLTAERLGLSPVLMAAANSVGGTMGKMIDAPSIVVAAVATCAVGQEARILRRVAPHSLALAGLVGLWVMAQSLMTAR